MDATTYQGSQRDTAATRTDTPLIEVPQSVRVLPQALIRDVGATQLSDAVHLVSGTSLGNDYGGTWDSIQMRGFDVTEGALLNGFAVPTQSGPRRDTALIERVEFLKGPGASLYGSSEPGGTYNVVTKKPLFVPLRRLGVELGTRDFRRATADLSGPLSGRVAYRLNLVAEDGAYRTRLADTKRYVIAPAVTWKLGNDTVLNYEADITRLRTPYDRGLIAPNGDVFGLPRDRYLGEPSRPNLHISGNVHQLTLQHGLAPDWNLRTGFMYRRTGNDGVGMEPGTLLRDGRTLTRRDSWRDMPSKLTSFQAEVDGRLQTGAWRHTVLAGIVHSRFEHVGDIRGSNPAVSNYGIDILAPTYGAAEATSRPIRVARQSENHGTAAYVQDQVDLTGAWKVLAGVRVDHFHQRGHDLVRNLGTDDQKHTAVTPRLGLVYLITPDLSAFVSHGRSFKPNAGMAHDGSSFDPQRGSAVEAGLKWQSADQRLTASASVYEIRKRNVLSRDPEHADFNVATGQVRSRGLELDVAGELDPHWRLSASAALTDAETTRDNTASLVGKRFSGVPKHSAALFVMYTDVLPGGARYGVGGGASHVGKRAVDNANTLFIPGYTAVRLSGFWQATRQMRLTLTLRNALDRYYFESAFGSSRLQPGLGRQVIAGIQYDF